MQQKLIRDLKPGDDILHFFIVRKKEIRERKDCSEPYLAFEFGDSTGRITGTLWKDIQKISRNINIHDVIKLKGSVINYKDYPHITIEKIRKTAESDKVIPDQFIPKISDDIENFFLKLTELTGSIENTYLKKLLSLLFEDQKFINNFKNSPAGKLWHHNYIGGLVEHTLAVAEICHLLSQQYKHVNRDILLTGAILHDIGKIYELTTNGFVDYSTEGRLLGHMALAYESISAKINSIPDFPVELKNRILHCILSHHGQREHGSPVVPMTMEAFLLHYADEIDSKMNSFQRIENKDKNPEKVWSNYVNLLDRFLYFGEAEM